MEVTTLDRQRIKLLALEFRDALDRIPKDLLPEPIRMWLQSFPCGCCHDATVLAAAYLADNGFHGANRIHGQHGGADGEIESHVWLQLDSVTIDITADQELLAEYGLPRVMVIDGPSEFHESFEVNEEDIVYADFRDFYRDDREMSFLYLRGYELIVRHLRKSATE